MSQLRLQGPRIVPVIGHPEAAGVPQHVGLRLEAKLGSLSSNQPGKSRCGAGTERATRSMLALQLANLFRIEKLQLGGQFFQASI
jgi:hypothetical protein